MASSFLEKVRPPPSSHLPAVGEGRQATLRTALGAQSISGRPLPPAERSLMEGRFGHSFGRVRIHTGGPAAAAVQDLGANAATIGLDVAFAPGRFQSGDGASRRTLAHELTHVVQQGAEARGLDPAASAPSAGSPAAEAEAARNAGRVAMGESAAVELQMPAGTPQLEKDVVDEEQKKKDAAKAGEKVSGSAKVERGFDKKQGEDATNNFAVTAEVKVPLLPGPRLGSSFLLKQLTIKNKGSASGPAPFSLGSVQLSKLQSDIALDILKLEVPKSELPKPLSFGAALKGSGSIARDLDKSETTGSVGATASVEQGVKVEDLIPDSAGSLSLGAKLGGNAGLKQSFGGDKPGTSASVTGSVGGSAEFKSRPLRGPLPTLGGLLGDEAQVGVGASADFTTGLDSEKGPTAKFGAGGKLGLSGKRAFLELNLKSEVELDAAGGSYKATGTKLVAGGAVGFKF